MLIPFVSYLWRWRCNRRRSSLVRLFIDQFYGRHGLVALFSASAAGSSMEVPFKVSVNKGFDYLKK